MNEFIFSVSATTPVFLLIVIGYILKKSNILGKDFSNSVSKYVFNIGFPFLLFRDISRINMAESFDRNYIVFCAVVTTISFFAVWGLSHLIIKNPKIRGSFVQGSCRGSAASLGLAFIMNMYGSTGMAPLMIIAAVPLYNVYSVIILSIEGEDVNLNDINFRSILKSIVINPIIIGILIGIITSIIQLQLPVILNKVVDNVASTASPMALLAIGAGFKMQQTLGKIGPILVGSTIKLLLLPLVFVPIGVLIGFRDETLISLLIMLGSPATSNCYIMAKSMKNDEILAGSIVGFTTLFASVTLTLGIYVLKLMNYI